MSTPARASTATAPSPANPVPLRRAGEPATRIHFWCQRCVRGLDGTQPQREGKCVTLACQSKCTRCQQVRAPCRPIPVDCVAAADELISAWLEEKTSRATRSRSNRYEAAKGLDLAMKNSPASASLPRPGAPGQKAPVDSEMQLLLHALRTLVEVTAQGNGILLPSWLGEEPYKLVPPPDYPKHVSKPATTTKATNIKNEVARNHGSDEEDDDDSDEYNDEGNDLDNDEDDADDSDDDSDYMKD